jgi:hypothetical protein
VKANLPDHLIEKQRLSCGDIYIIRASWETSAPDDNVFGVDQAGNVLWRIRPVPKGSKDSNPYTTIFFNEAGELIGYCWMGLDAKINPLDGTIEVPPHQRPW